MGDRKLVYIGDDVLRKKALRVRDFDPQLHELLDDMLVIMEQGGVGLAAPQVGVSQRAILVKLPADPEEYGAEAGVLYEVMNPEIIKASRELVEGVEACLSIPGYFGTVDRHVAITVRGQDRYGKEIRIKARDWFARVFQHEIDHLDGVLFIDRASAIWKAGEPAPWEQEAEGSTGEEAEATTA